jgi:hypothetical protein
MNGWSYYRWIVLFIEEKKVEVDYTHRHSDDIMLPLRLNTEADHYVSSAQQVIDQIPAAPAPTFLMDDYTFYHTDDGWIKSNICSFINKYLQNLHLRSS